MDAFKVVHGKPWPLCYEPAEIIDEYGKQGKETGRRAFWLGPFIPSGETLSKLKSNNPQMRIRS